MRTAALGRQGREAPEDAQDARDGEEHLGEARDGDVLGAHHRLETLGAHRVAADAEDAHVGAPAAQLAQHSRAVEVGGRLAGDDQDGARISHGSRPKYHIGRAR